MTRHGTRFWLAAVCVAAATGLCLGAPLPAGADEIRFLGPPIDRTPTGALKTPAARASTVSRAQDDSSPAGRVQEPAEPAAAAILPELPPDAANEPPTMPAADLGAASSSSPAPDEPRPDLRPVAKLGDEPTAADGVETSVPPVAPPPGAAASAWDVEAASEAMLKEDVKTRPVGARNWRAARIAIGVFYFERGFAPLWTREGVFTPSACAAIARLSHAEDDGLDLSAFAVPAANGKAQTPAQLAQADVTLSQAIVAYAVQATGGRIEPSSISSEITAKPEVADPFNALALVAAAANPDAALEDFNPPHKAYRDLRDKLAELRAERAPHANFQRSNGLSASGLLTADTVQPLSGGDSSRQEAAILANMEMWRWEPRDMGAERVEVNVPDFTLKVTQGEVVVHRARVIVGKPDTPTAIFSNQIKYLLLNPAWNVPMSIIKKEMLPKLALDPDYLTRAGFEVTQKGGTTYVRQPPGERNALGHILFMFPNEHSIYLHDTPGRGLFASSRRAFSHGCVRVDDPMRLGELAMGGAEAGWTQTRLRSLVGDVERTIFLPHPLAIHIEYFTAFVDDFGALQMREDIYGHMRRVEAALGLESQG
jgi:murein L,D-transpeptidase YcbB/YkuD